MEDESSARRLLRLIGTVAAERAVEAGRKYQMSYAEPHTNFTRDEVYGLLVMEGWCVATNALAWELKQPGATAIGPRRPDSWPDPVSRKEQNEN
jgi:hypothetical protein